MTAMNNEFSYQNGISLKEFFCKALEEFSHETDLKFQGRDKALDLNAQALESRLQHLNEWRQQLNSERDAFLTRNEYNLKHELLISKIEQLQKFMWIAVGTFAAVDYVIKFIK
jgi:hypothetical protein